MSLREDVTACELCGAIGLLWEFKSVVSGETAKPAHRSEEGTRGGEARTETGREATLKI